MLNRVYVEAFNLEDNNKIDLIRRMMGLDDYETLSLLFHKIENGLPITDRQKRHLSMVYFYDGESYSIPEVKEWLTLSWQMFEYTPKIQMLMLADAWDECCENLAKSLCEDLQGIINKCKKFIGLE